VKDPVTSVISKKGNFRRLTFCLGIPAPSKPRRYHPPPRSNQPPSSELHLHFLSYLNHTSLIIVSTLTTTYTKAHQEPNPPNIKHKRQQKNTQAAMSASLTSAQVKEHATPEKGLYIIIDNSVYSMASFADEHPGGSKILKRVGGKGMCFSCFLL
jgi:hypothetical protein